jgi:hypothetical protein
MAAVAATERLRCCLLNIAYLYEREPALLARSSMCVVESEELLAKVTALLGPKKPLVPL